MTKIVCVSAIFPPRSQAYTYFVREGDDPKVGDVIVTSLSDEFKDSFGSCREAEVKTAIITGLHSIEMPKATKFYLQLISIKDLQKRRKENYLMVELQKRKAAARSKLQKMLEEQNYIEMYAKLAETNPEAAKLIAILKGEDDGAEAEEA